MLNGKKKKGKKNPGAPVTFKCLVSAVMNFSPEEREELGRGPLSVSR